MEKNNEKDLRTYFQPETEIVMIGGADAVMQGGIENGSYSDIEEP